MEKYFSVMQQKLIAIIISAKNSHQLAIEYFRTNAITMG